MSKKKVKKKKKISPLPTLFSKLLVSIPEGVDSDKENDKTTTSSQRKMIEIQHFYNKCTTALSHGVDPTHCGAHPM
jgi:hypothetical protein